MTAWNEFKDIVCGILADNVVDTIEEETDYDEDDIDRYIEIEYQNLIENLDYEIGIMFDDIEQRVKKKLFME